MHEIPWVQDAEFGHADTRAELWPVCSLCMCCWTAPDGNEMSQALSQPKLAKGHLAKWTECETQLL